MQQIPHNEIDYTISFQKGEENGFAWYFRNLYPALTFYAFKITADKEAAEEIASQAFLKIWERHEKFDNSAAIKAYLYRIVRNDALKQLKRKKQQSEAGKEILYLYGNAHEKDSFSNLIAAEISRDLLTAVRSLPAECSKVFRLLYIEGKTVKEVAQELNLSPSTIKTQKARGLATLRKTLYSRISILFTMLISFVVHFLYF